MQVYQDLLTRAQGVSNTPYNPYGGELTAPVNQQQQMGIAGINAGAGFAQPYIQNALGMAQNASQPITAAQIQQYSNPFTQQVVQATQNQFNNQNAQQQQKVVGNAISQGALGGNRTGVAQAELANQQSLAQSPVIANLMSQGYSQGVSTALAEQQAQQAGAYSLGNLGVAGQNSILTGANAQIGAGTLEQQTQQARDAAQYQQFMQQMGYPFQTAQWLAGIGTGVGSQMGGTSQGSTTGPAPNMFGQIMGGLAGGAGILGSSGAFGATGWLSDRRAKENIRRIGKLNDGQHIYRFNYKGDNTTHIGLMAQDVEKKHPDAVHEVNGLKAVDYDAATEHVKERWQGGVANYDVGGAVDPNSAGLAGVPYAGIKGYVPGMNLTLGKGPPQASAPGLPQQPGNDFKALGDQAKNLGGLANTIRLGMNNGGLGDDGLGNKADSNWDGGTPLEGSSFIGMGGIGSAARGGHIGYAEGGTPSFDSRFTGVAPDDGSIPVLDGNQESPLDSAQWPHGPEDAPQDVAPSELKSSKAPSLAPSPSASVAGVAAISREPAGVASVAAPLSPSTGSQPRGIRNNNPGNIEDGAFARSQPGYKGSDGRFAVYTSPEAGSAAASNLLKSYGNKGVNTIAGIVNRWAPAADNNDVGAYVRAVAKATGLDPNAPLDMNDPTLRSKIAGAMFSHENGIPGIGDTLEARNYNRAAGANGSASAVGDTAELSAEAKKPAGVSGIDWGSESKLWPTLMSAGFGMMASKSPFAGVAIGEGGQQGVQTYQALKQQEAARTMSQTKLDLEARKLSQEADRHAKELALKAMPYQGQLTAHEQAQVATDRAKLAETARQHDLALRTPVKYGETRNGTPLMALPRPGKDGVEFYPIDPKTGTVSASPLGGGLKGASAPTPGTQGRVGDTVPAQFIQTAGDATERALAEAPPVEIRAAQPAASSQARSEAYLMELAKDDPRYAADIKAIANYQMSPAQFSLRNNRRERAMGDVMLYDPTYDQRRYNTTNASLMRFATGKQGDAVRSFSVAVEHLGTAEELGKALQNGDIQLVNSLRNTIKTQFGYPEAPAFDTAKQIVADEIAKAVIGGQNAESDRRGLQENLKGASSPAQLNAVIKTFKELMAGQIVGFKHQYESSTGLHNFEDMLTPRARLEVSRLMADRDAKLRGTTIGTSPTTSAVSGVPAPAAKPTLQQFLDKAQAANPTATPQDLTDYYNKKYGTQ